MYQDKEGKIISANPAAQQILGLTLDQLKGKTSIDPDWKVITPDGVALDGNQHPSMVALQTGEPVKDFIMAVFHPEEKQHHWIRVDAVPEYRGNEQAPFQVFTMFEDISESIQIEGNQDLAKGDDSK